MNFMLKFFNFLFSFEWRNKDFSKSSEIVTILEAEFCRKWRSSWVISIREKNTKVLMMEEKNEKTSLPGKEINLLPVRPVDLGARGKENLIVRVTVDARKFSILTDISYCPNVFPKSRKLSEFREDEVFHRIFSEQWFSDWKFALWCFFNGRKRE